MKDRAPYLAGLTHFTMERDKTTRLLTPAVPHEPGTIHAVTGSDSERQRTEPHIIEDTGAYMAALCGALVKVVLPVTFKPSEDGACPECVEELSPETRKSYGPMSGGGSWWTHGGLNNPGYRQRRQAERQQTTGT